MSSLADPDKTFSKNETIKGESNLLRGTILEGLADESTGALAEADTQLTKFHGIYQQDDRDLRKERRQKKLERAYCFMIRVRAPGGMVTTDQWLAMDALADDYANGTLKLTTRQAFQFHGVIKTGLKPTLQGIDRVLMDTIAACGDVNRNVMVSPNPYQSAVHAAVQDIGQAISDHLTPRTDAYREIWLDGEKVEDEAEEGEPIYGKTYLPRKFKIAMAVPPINDVDVLAHDLGYVANFDGDRLTGFTVTVGGGMGMTHGNTRTYPRLADPIGSCAPEQAVAVAEAVVKVQRDFGDRADRKHARLKYTFEDMGRERFLEELHKRLDFELADAEPFAFERSGDRYGWVDGTDGKKHLTLFVQNGRVYDNGTFKLKTALREIAGTHDGDMRLSPNQNLVIGNVPPEKQEAIERILTDHGVPPNGQSGLRLNAMACVALPTCGLALAESERYLPSLVDRLDAIVEDAGIREDEILIRMTGCPNGCARPYLGEIGLVGKAPGKYNLYLGAAFDGTRVNKLFRENVTEDQIVEALKPILERYAKERDDGERFGDFVIRHGFVEAVEVSRTDFWS